MLTSVFLNMWWLRQLSIPFSFKRGALWGGSLELTSFRLRPCRYLPQKWAPKWGVWITVLSAVPRKPIECTFLYSGIRWSGQVVKITLKEKGRKCYLYLSKSEYAVLHICVSSNSCWPMDCCLVYTVNECCTFRWNVHQYHKYQHRHTHTPIF